MTKLVWLAGVAGIVLSLYTLAPESANRALALLADGSSANREFEYRFPGVKHSRIQATRGEDSSAGPAFLETLARIRRALDRDPTDANWLHAQARAEILSGHPREGIRSLNAALDLTAGREDAFLDLGIAYALKADQEASADEYTLAVEAFSKGLARHPDDSALLFNRGIAYRKLNLFDAAIGDFEDAQRGEKEAGWNAEISERIGEARRRRARLISLARPAHTIEDRIDEALKNDIRAAWAADPVALARLQDLAAILEKQHGDLWLSEILRMRPTDRDRRAAQFISRLTGYRLSGQIDQYDSVAPDIDWLSRQNLGRALAAWRDLELLFRATHSRDLSGCPSTDEMLAQSDRFGYRQIRIQILLERSTCDSGQNRLDLASEDAQRAADLAASRNFAVANVRARGFLASGYVDQGRYREAYGLARESLDQVLDNGYPLRRAHEFYNTIMRAADRLEHWNTARAAARMASEVAGGFGSGMFEMVGQTMVADFTMRLGEAQSARREYAKAIAMSSRLSPSPNAAAYAALARAGFLESESDLEGLRQLRQSMLVAGNPFFENPVDASLAEVALQRGDRAGSLQYSGRLLQSLTGSASRGAGTGRNTFRRELSRAATVSARARLELGDVAGAYHDWQAFRYREARLLGSKAEQAEIVLRDGAAILVLAELGDRIGEWLQSASEIDFFWALESRDVISAKAGILRRLCSNPRSSRKAIRGLEEELWRSIFADPLRKHPELRGLRIESTGVLNSLPLAAIFADLAPALLENGSSLTPYPVAAEDAHNSKWTLIVGSTIDRQLAVSLPVLSDLEDEVRSVAGEMASRSAPAEILRGVEATPAALARSAAHARVLHFAGHAIHWRDGVALVASPDPDERDQDRRMGIWRISADSPIPAELAVFSACSTADLEENETAKPERLSEAALLAGARNVIGTLWDVDSAAAARFNALFYRYWKQGMRIEQAVGAAALSLRASTEFSHPYYWAPFALFQAPPQRRNN